MIPAADPTSVPLVDVSEAAVGAPHDDDRPFYDVEHTIHSMESLLQSAHPERERERVYKRTFEQFSSEYPFEPNYRISMRVSDHFAAHHIDMEALRRREERVRTVLVNFKRAWADAYSLLREES